MSFCNVHCEEEDPMKVRAIFIGDVRFDQCPAFELNTEMNYFEMIIDKEIKYENIHTGSWLHLSQV